MDVLPNVGDDDDRIIEATPVTLFDTSGAPLAGGTPLENATEVGRTYSAGSGTQVVSQGNRLLVRFLNPDGSGKVAVVRYRAFGNDRQGADDLLQRVFIVNPAALPTPTSAGANPLNSDPANPASSSVADVSFAVSGTDISAGNLGSTMPLNGILAEIFIPRFVYPSQAFGYQIDGAGGGVTATEALISATFVWEERDYG